jgi:hypothetical protein
VCHVWQSGLNFEIDQLVNYDIGYFLSLQLICVFVILQISPEVKHVLGESCLLRFSLY